jgi:hypothetical protein
MDPCNLTPNVLLRKTQTSPISLIDYNLNPDAAINDIWPMVFCSIGMDSTGAGKFP